MPRWLKVLLIVGGSGALLLGLLIGGVVWWFNAHGAELREQGIAAEAAGKEYGVGKTSEGCIDESIVRTDRADGFIGRALVGVFMKGCLASAPGDPALCPPVPEKNEIMKTATWRNQFCTAHGKRGNQNCFNLMEALQDYCHPKP